MTDKKMADPQDDPRKPSFHANTASGTGNSASPIIEIRKGDTELLRITISEYRGRTYIRIRAWYLDESGEYKPRNTGVSVRLAQVGEVVQGLMLAARAADPRGTN